VIRQLDDCFAPAADVDAQLVFGVFIEYICVVLNGW
jgi:hypothetical protein